MFIKFYYFFYFINPNYEENSKYEKISELANILRYKYLLLLLTRYLTSLEFNKLSIIFYNKKMLFYRKFFLYITLKIE